MTLPPLPAPARSVVYNESKGYGFYAYTAAQMENYARAAIAAHVPEAAFGNIAAVPASLTDERLIEMADDAQSADWGQWFSDEDALIRFARAVLAAAPQAVPVPAVTITDDPWHKLYRRAINEANGLTNYVEDRPELRGAERRLAAIEAEARTLAATFEPTPEKKP